MRKNVLELTGSFHQGGSERQAVQLARLVQNDGTFRVHVGCLDRSGSLRGEVDWLGHDEIPEFKLSSFHDANFLRQVANCARYIKSNNISVVHTHDFYTNIFGMCAAFWAGVPARIASKRETFSKSTSQMLIERQAFRLAAKIAANADAVKKFLIVQGVPEAKIEVIHNGLDLERLAPSGFSRPEILNALGISAEIDTQIVTIVANLRSDVKNHRMFLRAAKTVRAWTRNIAFVLAGEGDLMPSLQKFAGDLGIANDVFFIGGCGNVQDLLAISNIGVLSSQSEGFSNAILEYMSAALPVVATRVGGAAEAVIEGETGFLVDSDDDAAMAEKLLTLLKNREMAERFGNQGRRVVEEKFSVTTQLGKTLDLYDAVLKNDLNREVRV